MGINMSTSQNTVKHCSETELSKRVLCYLVLKKAGVCVDVLNSMLKEFRLKYGYKEIDARYSMIVETVFPLYYFGDKLEDLYTMFVYNIMPNQIVPSRRELSIVIKDHRAKNTYWVDKVLSNKK